MKAAPRAPRFIAVGLLSSLALLPFLPLFARMCPALEPVERVARIWFDFHCERDPARTLSVHGIALGVCARCSGIYFGLGLGAALRWPQLTPAGLRLWVLAATALMLADVVLERFALHGAWPAVRVTTGWLLAYPVGVGLALAVSRAPNTAQRP